MKERYFYKKKELFFYLNNPKPYPTSQIYAALTMMINDSSEYLLDKYDRTGNLINIGEYYLFQPSELNSNNISLYDRSAPIDYKHSMVKINIKSDIIENENKIESINEEKNLSEQKQKGKIILNELEDNFNLIKNTDQVIRGEDNWYKYCGVVIKKLSENGYKMSTLLEDVMNHLLDSLSYIEKIEILNFLNLNCKENNQTIDKEEITIGIKKYFCNKVIHGNNITAIILFDGPSRINNLKVFVLKENKWINAEPEDIRDITPLINEKYKLRPNLNKYVGFMGFEDKNKYMIFKVKDTSKIRNTGSRCDQAGKKKTIDVLNEIIGSNIYTKENTRGIVQQELCIIQEFILRNNERIQKEGKTWFLNTELAVINDF
jgi:hypothetical protein